MSSKKNTAARAIIGLFWETEVSKDADGTVRLTALQPISHMSVKQAAKALGCTESTVADLYRHGLIKGFKPGARTISRTDGRASNATLRICCDSVLEYLKRQEKASKDWQEG